MRKFKHTKLIKITSAQIEAVERQYWSRYNNEVLEASLRHKLNTNQVG